MALSQASGTLLDSASVGPEKTLPSIDDSKISGAISGDRERLVSGVGVALAGRLVGRGLRVAGEITIARLLGPSAFGLYAVGWTIVRLLGLISPLGLQNGVTRFASEHWRTDPLRTAATVRAVLLWTVVSGFFFGSLLALMTPWLSTAVFQDDALRPVLWWCSVAVVLVSTLGVTASAARVSQDMRASIIVEDLLPPAIGLLTFLVLYGLGFTLQGALIAVCFSQAISVLLALRYARRLFPALLSCRSLPPKDVRALFAFSLPVSLSAVFTTALLWIDRLMVAHFFSASEVGVYQAAARCAFFLTLIAGSVGAMLAPMIAEHHHRGDVSRLNRLFVTSTKLTLYLCLPVFLVILFSAKDLLGVAFGPAYSSGYLILIVLSVGQMLVAATGSIGVMLVMTGNQRPWLVASGSMFGLNLLMNMTLLPWLGPVGAAIASTCSLGGLVLLGLFHLRLSRGFWPYDRRYAKGIAAAVATGAALCLVRLIDVELGPARLLVNVVIGGSVFAGTMVALRLDVEDREFVRTFLDWRRANTRLEQVCASRNR